MSLTLRQINNIYSGIKSTDKGSNAPAELNEKQEQAMMAALSSRAKNGR